MSSIEIHGRPVYEATYIKEQIPAYFAGCSVGIGRIIEKKNIPEDKYMWCSYSKKTGYTIVDPAQVKKRKLYIDKAWVEENVPTFGTNNKELDIETAPPLLELTDGEKFRDEKNEVYDIQVRGERHVDKIWFRARDVENMLALQNVRGILYKEECHFRQDIHYKTFIQKKVEILDFPQDKSQDHKILFLTYHGLIKLLFSRRHPIADQFQKWAINILFVHQMGAEDQKEALGADLMGVDIRTLKNVLDCSVDDFPCVYLFYLGTAGDMRSTIPNQLADTTPLFKYGYTKNLKSRLEKHVKTFGKHIQLKWHVIVDPFYLSQAECDLKNAMEGYIIDHPRYTEIIGLNERIVNSTIHHIYKNIGKHYAGRLKEIQHKMETIQLEKQMEGKHLREMLDKERQHYHDILVQKDACIELQKELLQVYRANGCSG